MLRFDDGSTVAPLYDDGGGCGALGTLIDDATRSLPSGQNHERIREGK
jgi:hypothetical protein